MVASAPAALGLDPRVQAVPLRGMQFQGSGLTCEEVFALSAASGVYRGLSVTKGHTGRTQSRLGERVKYERLRQQVPTSGEVSNGSQCWSPDSTHQLWAALKGYSPQGIQSSFGVNCAF